MTQACISLNNYKSEWFLTELGVRQGDNLSPTLFSLFINDLARAVKDLNLGIQIGENNISILLYADDIAIISKKSY